MTSPLRLSALAVLMASSVGITAVLPTEAQPAVPGVSSIAAAPIPAANPTTPTTIPSTSSESSVDGTLEPTVEPVAEPLVVPEGDAETTNYSGEGMSIDFPAAWMAELGDEGLMIANVTTVEAELVATQVVRMAAPPGPVVNANIDSFIDEGSAVGRYQSVTIDGQDALVMWLADRPDSLESAIATFIGYGDETILLFSRYAPTNETAEDDILRLHTSFANLAAATPTVEEVSPEAGEVGPEDE